MSQADHRVYLIHFEQPLKHAQHYLGFATDLRARIAKHRAGHGARLLAAVNEAGIRWFVVRTWPGSRLLEAQLKGRGKKFNTGERGKASGLRRHCPVCKKGRSLYTVARRWRSCNRAAYAQNPQVAACPVPKEGEDAPAAGRSLEE